jgi:hypothetical protein
MLNLSDDIGANDYTMACGPSSEVLNTLPVASSPKGTSYCVLTSAGKVIFGTFADAGEENVRQLILQVYNDTMYSSQIKPGDVHVKACDGKGVSGSFEECKGAIKNLHVYVYEDQFGTDSVYLIVSEQPLASVSPTFFASIIDFFKGLFSWL